MNLRSPLFWGYALLLGFVAVITGEIVTFAMLGLILIVLNDIHRTLREVRDRLDRETRGMPADAEKSEAAEREDEE
ncbi:MAG: hypothetical protein AB2404_12485 [Planifilum fimeticola]|jgi:hypothetical protein